MSQEYTAAEVKAKLYAVLERVAHGEECVVTVRGKRVAKIVGFCGLDKEDRGGTFGSLRDLFVDVGDVVSPLDQDQWTEPDPNK